MTEHQTRLDPTLHSPEVRDFEKALLERVVGQDRAVRRLARVYQVYLAGLSTPGRPLVNLLFLGPTGSGKTRLVEAASEVLFGDARAVVKIDCAEFQHSHEIAKLIGSPPGYLGHRFDHARLTRPGRPQKQQIPHRTPRRVQAGQKHLINLYHLLDCLVLPPNAAAQGAFKLSRIVAATVRIEHCCQVRSHKNRCPRLPFLSFGRCSYGFSRLHGPFGLAHLPGTAPTPPILIHF